MAAPQAIYLDHAATTPCDPRVVEAMTPFFTTTFGDPACRHEHGAEAGAAVEAARGRAAGLIHASPGEIVWTAGASESNNLAIKGVARAARAGRGSPGHIVTSAIEHKAVLQPCRRLMQEGFEVSFVEPGPDGVVTAAVVADAIRQDTLLVSIIAVNNEIGTISEVPRIGRLCREPGILFHPDATQMLGVLPIDVERDHIDLMSWSGHKISGPKGVGALFVRQHPPIELQPLIEGGAHERGLRAGTLNVPGIVGLGRACELCGVAMATEGPRLEALRCRLEEGLARAFGDVVLNGHQGRRAPHITNVCLPTLAGTPVIDHVRGVACSSGSAISSAGRTASHVLTAIGVSDELAVTALRLSLGRTTIERDIDSAIDRLAATAQGLGQTVAR